MSTDLKFSLITTLIVLGVIVAGGLTVSSALISSLLRVGVSSILSLSKTQKAYLLRTQTYAARFFATNSQLTSAQKCSR